MPKRIFQKFFPTHHVRGQPSLQVFGKLVQDPYLMHLNRRSVSGAFAVGLFTAFIPVPFQMLLAAALAILFRVNLPISVILVFTTNPITIPPLIYTAFKIGQWVLDGEPHVLHFEPSLTWVKTELISVWRPLLLGCILLGSGAATLGFTAVRLYWRINILQKWRTRQGKYTRRG